MPKIICEFGKRKIVLKQKEYEIPKEVANYIMHNIQDLKVEFKFN